MFTILGNKISLPDINLNYLRKKTASPGDLSLGYPPLPPPPPPPCQEQIYCGQSHTQGWNYLPSYYRTWSVKIGNLTVLIHMQPTGRTLHCSLQWPDKSLTSARLKIPHIHNWELGGILPVKQQLEISVSFAALFVLSVKHELNSMSYILYCFAASFHNCA